MTNINDPIDAAFESLRQSDFSQRDSFFSQLENRMISSNVSKPRSGRAFKLGALLASAVVLTTAVGFAAVETWTHFGPFKIDASGVVTDVEGNAVGQSIEIDEVRSKHLCRSTVAISSSNTTSLCTLMPIRATKSE